MQIQKAGNKSHLLLKRRGNHDYLGPHLKLCRPQAKRQRFLLLHTFTESFENPNPPQNQLGSKNGNEKRMEGGGEERAKDIYFCLRAASASPLREPSLRAGTSNEHRGGSSSAGGSVIAAPAPRGSVPGARTAPARPRSEHREGIEQQESPQRAPTTASVAGMRQGFGVPRCRPRPRCGASASQQGRLERFLLFLSEQEPNKW